ncbi:MAG: hypothetical protein HC945_03675 [Nitrosarchaeum sp.]|nr:hypothetical protein [Nitrosarchaeum sp.]
MNLGISETTNARLKEFGFSEEKAEVLSAGGEGASYYLFTGYPKPLGRLQLVLESPSISIEETYYWFLEHLRTDFSFGLIDKITDSFSASEQSSFWGQAQQRLSIQQDRVQQYMASIGKMIKDLFALVRELRIIDEKLAPREIWDEAAKAVAKGKPAESVDGFKSADATLKSEYTDMVENRGGQVQPGSIYHLSSTVGYVTLPDLFFNTRVLTKEQIDKVVDGMDWNPNVKNVLRRKLFQFVNWKLQSDHELRQRRRFQLQYLRQHWDTVKMYMAWVKPHLRNVKRLAMNPERANSPDLISAFEGSIAEIEILTKQPKIRGWHPCVLMTFVHRTRPQMEFHREGFQHRGPVHVGRVEVTLRAYAWTEEQVGKYREYREKEEMDLLGLVDGSVESAMEALSADLDRYLAEAGAPDTLTKKHDPPKKEEEQVSPSSILEPFVALFKGFAELGLSFFPGLYAPQKKEEKKSSVAGAMPGSAAGAATFALYQAYKNYKKSHRLLSW